MPITPLRRQYLRIKQRYPQAIVFFRLGDFYETFDDDARITSRELEITLTSREMGKGQRVPLAGIPYHALDNYLAKLISKGYKVAICEQMTPPGNGLVERDVIRVVTPGTVVEPGLLADKSNNYLVSLIIDGDEAGISYVDITTGEFATAQLPVGQVSDELERLHPAELLITEGLDTDSLMSSASITRVDEYWFDLDAAQQTLIDHFEVASLEGYGCAHLPMAVRAAGAIIRYLQENQKAALGQLDQLTTYSTQSFMVLDAHTRHNLELFSSARWGASSGSLLTVIDLTETAMGGRLLKKWLGQPLLDINQLTSRQEAVTWLYSNTMVRHKVMSLLREIADLERLVNRVRGSIAIPRDLVALRVSLEKLADVKAEIEGNEGFPSWLGSELKPCPDAVSLIQQAIVDAPGASLEKGGVVKPGFSKELDEIRGASAEAKRYLANLERQERERTGIKSLKVGYNRVFGYYIEVSKSNLELVPESYIRKQTLTGGERFYTPELKEYESVILNAQERIIELETAIFRQICQQIAGIGEQILSSARALAEIDVFTGLAEAAVRYGYARPELTAEDAVSIKGGRHPVVERSLGGDGFVPNDTYLCNKDTQLIILTGPNMSGKSTYLKQVALIVLLAQIGSFVPADSASISIVDRIFTRIGAQEDLAAGQSTFMVEMVEAANILNNATSKSLIILDEIGRGTSTYDGLSIAWAVSEFIHNHPRLRAKTIFATHYHELVELAGFLPRVKNFNVAVAEEEGKVIFLRKVVPGGADKSYGIHVAQLAGLPASVVHRAEEVLAGLENGQSQQKQTKAVRPRKESPPQLALFGDKSPLVEEISQLDIDSMSPLEAITRLYELKRKAKEAGSQ
ncbi:MAG: DNA mismatch repair protein MutS [Dehalococcoidia bacterium]|nr:DNA mismatch repair protein MutS [Dehalococcoidia bacterium]